jgi:exopolyphosphatase / guanosine-5'-triphosphate,3'-diphosphate pyrophosphatase
MLAPRTRSRPRCDISRVRPRAPAATSKCSRPRLNVRRACIDIGSNTTRLLVADCDGERLREVHQERAFTHVRRGLSSDEEIVPEKIAEVAQVVAAQVRAARELGACEVRGVATAAVRQAGNRDKLLAAVRGICGLEIEVLSAEDEARLAFGGAARTLGYVPGGPLGVVDVGGGSSELVVGTAPDRVSWCRSIEVGSGQIADACLHSDPPTPQELASARVHVADALAGVRPPRVVRAVAVGGSAASLLRIAGPKLDGVAFTRSLELLAGAPAPAVARRFGLAADRVHLLPAGLLILQAASELLEATLEIARGGLREGVLLEGADG